MAWSSRTPHSASQSATARLPATARLRLAIDAYAALALANARYWMTVAPVVRAELARWESVAQRIPDPELQALALGKLREEGFNAQVAAILATVAPRAQRARAVAAIVALEVLFDYLDGLTESPAADALREGRDLYRAFIDAVAPAREAGGDYYRFHPRSESCYLVELVAAVRGSLGALPAATATGEVIMRSAARCAEAQVRVHAVAREGTAQVERWAISEAAGGALEWREFLASAASSVLAMHALIAAAADDATTPARALAIDAIYLPICVMPSMLDSSVDYELDARAGHAGFARFYQDQYVLAQRLGKVADQVLAAAPSAPNGAHCIVMLAGIVAYYTSNPRAENDFARPVLELLRRRLRPLITPTLAIVRGWRLAKRMKA
jgi:tetraprenyl-beta-curcumene synthase